MGGLAGHKGNAALTERFRAGHPPHHLPRDWRTTRVSYGVVGGARADVVIVVRHPSPRTCEAPPADISGGVLVFGAIGRPFAWLQVDKDTLLPERGPCHGRRGVIPGRWTRRLS